MVLQIGGQMTKKLGRLLRPDDCVKQCAFSYSLQATDQTVYQYYRDNTLQHCKWCEFIWKSRNDDQLLRLVV